MGIKPVRNPVGVDMSQVHLIQERGLGKKYAYEEPKQKKTKE